MDGHAGQTFVVLVPGSVAAVPELAGRIYDDVAVLLSLQVRCVLVVGGSNLLDQLLRERGCQESQFVRGSRLTDGRALQVAKEVHGATRIAVEEHLSRALPASTVRRHGLIFGHGSSPAAVQVVSGNYLVARRRGVVNGVDFQYTGEVQGIWAEAVESQLSAGNLVVLGNLGYNALGECLNCSSYEVAAVAARQLEAQKFIAFHKPDPDSSGLAPEAFPEWLPLADAQELLQARGFVDNGNALWSVQGAPAAAPEDCAAGLRELAAAVHACRGGVVRSHIVDPSIDGALLLELFTQDGCGTMVSTDLYEGTRPARWSDIPSIQALLRPLEVSGVLRPRPLEELQETVQNFYVVERDGRLLACGALIPLGGGLAELVAFTVSADYRSEGRGDALLTFILQAAQGAGCQQVALLTTRTADWFVERGFVWHGAAHSAPEELLPEARRRTADPRRNAQLYLLTLGPDPSKEQQPGKRIGC